MPWQRQGACIHGSCPSHVCLHLLYPCISTGGKFARRFFFEGQRVGNETGGACQQGYLQSPREVGGLLTAPGPGRWKHSFCVLQILSFLCLVTVPGLCQQPGKLSGISDWDLCLRLHCPGSLAILPSCCWEESDSF